MRNDYSQPRKTVKTITRLQAMKENEATDWAWPARCSLWPLLCVSVVPEWHNPKLNSPEQQEGASWSK